MSVRAYVKRYEAMALISQADLHFVAILWQFCLEDVGMMLSEQLQNVVITSLQSAGTGYVQASYKTTHLAWEAGILPLNYARHYENPTNSSHDLWRRSTVL